MKKVPPSDTTPQPAYQLLRSTCASITAATLQEEEKVRRRPTPLAQPQVGMLFVLHKHFHHCHGLHNYLGRDSASPRPPTAQHAATLPRHWEGDKHLCSVTSSSTGIMCSL